MPKLSDHLLERSLAATLAAIEIYNKPNFSYREEVFAILVINGWELLLKARLLSESAEALETITACDKTGAAKKSRTGANLTIGLSAALERTSVHPKVAENISLMVELRDAAIHFVNDSDIKYAAYTLGAASLRNYQRLCCDWFGRSLSEYNLFILPLGFAYSFKTLSLIDLGSKSTEIAALLNAVETARTKLSSEPTDDFHLVCEVQAQLASVKQLTDNEGITVGISPASSAMSATVVVRSVSPIDKYPLTFKELVARVKATKPDTKQNVISDIVSKCNMKGDPKYTAYNFRAKAHKDRYEKEGKLPKDPVVIYNEDAVKLILSKLS